MLKVERTMAWTIGRHITMAWTRSRHILEFAVKGRTESKAGMKTGMMGEGEGEVAVLAPSAGITEVAKR